MREVALWIAAIFLGIAASVSGIQNQPLAVLLGLLGAVCIWLALSPSTQSQLTRWRGERPMLSTIIAALVGGIIFGGGWWFVVPRPLSDRQLGFSGALHRITVGDAPNKELVAILLVTVTNRGVPAAILGWDVSVRPAGATEWTKLKTIHFSDLLSIPSADGTVVYRPEDAVYTKTQTPIATNDYRSGFIAVLLSPFVTRDQALDPATEFRITFTDVLERTVSFSAFSGVPTKPGFAPGMNVGFIPAAEAAALVGLIDEVKAGEVTEPGGTVEKPFPTPIPFMALVVSINNRGKPTIAQGFRLIFVFPNGSQVEGEPVALPNKMWLSPNEPIFGVDALENKTAQPIPTGDIRRGRLLFFFRALQRTDLDSPNSTVTLSYSDGFGHAYGLLASRTGSKSGEILRFPGLTYEPVPKPKP